jgi:RNA polymerase sigma-70 factor (ECF subfamily)
MIGKPVPPGRGRPAPDDVTDQVLVAACAAGDVSALGTLFDRFAGPVLGFLGRLREDPFDLEDLVQTTFLEVRRSARRYRAGASVKTWILAIAANVARHHVRSEVRRRALAAACADLPPGRQETPADTAERIQLSGRLASALRALDKDLAVAFVLCDLEDVTGAEAARLLGVRPATLWRRLYQARRRLRGAIEGTV